MARIRVESNVHEIYVRLTRDGDAADTVKTLATMKDVFVISVALGAKLKVRTPLSGPTVDIFDEDALKSRDVAIIQAIVLADRDDIAVLGDEATIIRVSQEFANTGIRMIRENLQQNEPAQSLAHLLLTG